ncbi:MAG: replication-relaxation family protein, partial [Caldilineaceae bacterium]|nr:replication-relaxation family protein [Caldilineaceae bacterium]
MKTNSGTKRRSLLRRTTQSPKALSERDVAVLWALSDFRVLSTLQIAMLFWRPSLAHKLAWWHLPQTAIDQVLASYTAHRVNERLDFAKWLLAIRRKQPEQLATLGPGFDLLVDPKWFGSLSLPEQQQVPITPQDWLLRLFDYDQPLPQAFYKRRRLPSEFISTGCKQGLRRLFDEGYIEPEEQPTRLQQGRKPLLWYLAKQGRDTLAGIANVPVNAIPWKTAGSYSPWGLPHRLENNDLRISTLLAANRHGWKIQRWIDDDQLRTMHSKKSERVKWQRPKDPRKPNGETVEEEGTVVADHYFWLDTGKNWHNFYEYDRGTKTVQYQEPEQNDQDFERKIYTFTAYYKSGLYAQRYPEAGKSMRVLIVTSSEARLQ